MHYFWIFIRLNVGFSQKSSIQATDRLMKEMKSIYKSESYKSGYYTVEPVDDNVYEWNVALVRVQLRNILSIT